MSQLLIGTKLISLAPLVAEKTLLLLGRLARQGRPIAFAGFLILIIIRTACKARPSYCFCSFSYSYSSYYSAAFFSELRRARAFIPTPYDRVLDLVGGKLFFVPIIPGTSGLQGEHHSYVIPMGKFQCLITHCSGHLETPYWYYCAQNQHDISIVTSRSKLIRCTSRKMVPR